MKKARTLTKRTCLMRLADQFYGCTGKPLDPDLVIRAYKYTRQDGTPRFRPWEFRDKRGNELTYELGYTYTESRFSRDRRRECAAGLNVATLEWVTSSTKGMGFKQFLVEFRVKDIVCIPYRHGGKFRVKRFDIVAEVGPCGGIIKEAGK